MDLTLQEILSQRQRLTPKMEQSLQILQMDQWELGEYIQELSIENPVIDLDELDTEPVSLSRKLEWLEAGDKRSRFEFSAPDDDDGNYGLDGLGDREESMDDVLLAQLGVLSLSADQQRLVAFLIGNLDENGYLSSPLDQLAQQLGVSLALMEQALEVLQKFDPPGVGAQSLPQCILLQLNRDGLLEPDLERLVSTHLDGLAKGSLRQVATALELPLEQVRDYVRLIAATNPKPCAVLGRPRYTRYIQPDLVVAHFKDHFEIMLSDYVVPRITVRKDYLQLLGNQADKEAQQYIEKKFQQAQWATNAVEARGKTLLAVGRCLVRRQQEFFTHGEQHLTPLSLAELANELDLHPSTISRAMKGKYLQCSFGLYPLRFFLSQSVAGADTSAGTSSTSSRALLRELVSGEDPANPYSDQQLADLLAQRGVSLARRTIAKYRTQLGILPVAMRRSKD